MIVIIVLACFYLILICAIIWRGYFGYGGIFKWGLRQKNNGGTDSEISKADDKSDGEREQKP